ncbi:MAG: ABC transporter ATP-binding protein [Acidobacteria bacterium]|nr:ABC transporter ATP-binding protein [Acidobacteriota bacterium]
MKPYYELRKTVLKVENVSLTLGGSVILRDVNAEIKDVDRPEAVTGQIVGMLGPSGVGKTRLFRILAGLDAPNTGQVLIGEAAVPVQRGMVGVVAQHYPLFAHRTVLSNLLVAARQSTNHKESTAAERATEMLRRFGLQDRANHYPAQLSGGQRQRVAIAQQFLCSDHFLLMDEPFSGLDPLALGEVSRLIREVAHSDTLNTIVIVTHDIVAALEVSDTIWLMGRDRSPDGTIIPGARIQRVYDLKEMGLAWRRDPAGSPELLELLREVRGRFAEM